MELIERFIGKTIGLDTSIFIYFIEKHKKYQKFLGDFFKNCDNGKIEIVTSTITLLEVLVLPFRSERYELADKYEFILQNSKGIRLLDINNAISKTAAQLRAKHMIRTPDSIQIATSIFAGAHCFITNDKSLQRIKDIEILILDQLI